MDNEDPTNDVPCDFERMLLQDFEYCGFPRASRATRASSDDGNGEAREQDPIESTLEDLESAADGCLSEEDSEQEHNDSIISEWAQEHFFKYKALCSCNPDPCLGVLPDSEDIAESFYQMSLHNRSCSSALVCLSIAQRRAKGMTLLSQGSSRSSESGSWARIQLQQLYVLSRRSVQPATPSCTPFARRDSARMDFVRLYSSLP